LSPLEYHTLVAVHNVKYQRKRVHEHLRANAYYDQLQLFLNINPKRSCNCSTYNRKNPISGTFRQRLPSHRPEHFHRVHPLLSHHLSRLSRMVRSVVLAATQFACSEDKQANSDKAEQLVRQAAAAGAQIILLQELFERQYWCQVQEKCPLERPRRSTSLGRPHSRTIHSSPGSPNWQRSSGWCCRYLSSSGPITPTSTASPWWTQTAAYWDGTVSPTFRMDQGTRRSSTLTRGTRASVCLTRSTAKWASPSVGTSGFRRRLVRWHCRALRSSCIPPRSDRSRRTRTRTPTRTGYARSWATQPLTWSLWWSPTASARSSCPGAAPPPTTEAASSRGRRAKCWHRWAPPSCSTGIPTRTPGRWRAS
ncbi:hypothetical protein Vretifemale_117, partial [Volvox reticuliferus]